MILERGEQSLEHIPLIFNKGMLMDNLSKMEIRGMEQFHTISAVATAVALAFRGQLLLYAMEARVASGTRARGGENNFFIYFMAYPLLLQTILIQTARPVNRDRQVPVATLRLTVINQRAFDDKMAFKLNFGGFKHNGLKSALGYFIIFL
jgi:hypothetical protein